ncbi:MAG: DUF3024 domain-containing protein [Actinomycetota bacterium]|nr:DUF3024 domain-containing protein [Actinomycetota bacterium]
MVPDLDLARIRKWINRRNDDAPDGVVNYELDVSDRAVTVLECRPPWEPNGETAWIRHPVARFRYTKNRHEWSLYWSDRNLKFHRYDLAAPTPHVETLIAEVEQDRTALFWG